MKFDELARLRYSCRKYQPGKVEKKLVEKIIHTARIAPSAVNYQPWHFIAVVDQVVKTELDACYARDWFKTAPMAIVVCADHNISWKRKDDGRDHAVVDASIAADHITLQAAEMGLATCWVCNFDVIKCTRLLQLPDGVEPVVILPLGYPDDAPVDRHFNRKQIEEVLHWNKFHYNENN